MCRGPVMPAGIRWTLAIADLDEDVLANLAVANHETPITRARFLPDNWVAPDRRRVQIQKLVVSPLSPYRGVTLHLQPYEAMPTT